jgi:hypothetical protein
MVLYTGSATPLIIVIGVGSNVPASLAATWPAIARLRSRDIYQAPVPFWRSYCGTVSTCHRKDFRQTEWRVRSNDRLTLGSKGTDLAGDYPSSNGPHGQYFPAFRQLTPPVFVIFANGTRRLLTALLRYSSAPLAITLPQTYTRPKRTEEKPRRFRGCVR